MMLSGCIYVCLNESAKVKISRQVSDLQVKIEMGGG